MSGSTSTSQTRINNLWKGSGTVNDTIALIVLSIVIIGQAIERYYYSKDMTQKLQDGIKAVMSRNIGEYVMATKPQRKEVDEPEPENDEIEMSGLTDEKFMEAIARK